MIKPPYTPIYQDGRWAVVDMSDAVKEGHQAIGVHPTYPWIMHYCDCAWDPPKGWWNFANDVPPRVGDDGLYCRECKVVPPDDIITIRELYR